MNILAVESTAKAASVAVLAEDRILSYSVADSGLTHSEVLLPMAEAALKAAKKTLGDMDLFAVTAGPGSFTGVRIGVATVKGLAFRDAPVKNCVAVSTLEALAENLLPLDGIYLPVMDARRGEVYQAAFCMRDGVLTRLTPDRAISLAALGEELRRAYPDTPIRLCGDGYEVAMHALSAFSLCLPETPPLLRTQNAASVAKCARRIYQTAGAVEESFLKPIYLRVPQAERDRLAGKMNQTTF